METPDTGERFMFAANPLGQLCALFAQGKYSEVELYEYGTEHDWADELPAPPNIGLWVWEYTPTGGSYDQWNGDYAAIDIDHGVWRALTPLEWHFVQNGENPWVPIIDAEEHEMRQEEIEFGNKNILEDELTGLFK